MSKSIDYAAVLKRMANHPMFCKERRALRAAAAALCDNEALHRELDVANAELKSIDDALDSVTRCIASTRADRIKDSFLHNELVADAVVFDAEKAEHSTRSQCALWIGQAKATGEKLYEAQQRVSELNSECERLRKEMAEFKARWDDESSWLASAADLGNSWAREIGVDESTGYSAENVRNLIDRLWNMSSCFRFRIAEIEAQRAETSAENARLRDALTKIAYSGTDYPPGMLREEFDHIQHRQCIGIAANALIGK